MARRERPRGPHGPREPGKHDHDGDHEPERSEPEGRDYAVIAELRGARWQGTAPPTAQAFARALSQWRRLPGAIATTATDFGNAATTLPSPPTPSPSAGASPPNPPEESLP